MEHEPKISLPEIVIITPYLLLIDVIGILLVMAGLDDFGLLDMVRFPITQLYIRIKGVKGHMDLIGNIVKLIPYVGAIPFVIFWVATIYIDRHPNVAAIANVATQKKPEKKTEPESEKKEQKTAEPTKNEK